MPVSWEELVADVTARYPVKESKMFGMPCLKRENGKVVAGHWKDGGLTVKLVDEAQREAASVFRELSSSTPVWVASCASGCMCPPPAPTTGNAWSSKRSAERRCRS
ncbi:MAG: hypothetical protein M3546_13375 [Actinomycetota bacterium]|nr:hypothetical protein [Actinomycetota bacterium]